MAVGVYMAQKDISGHGGSRGTGGSNGWEASIHDPDVEEDSTGPESEVRKEKFCPPVRSAVVRIGQLSFGAKTIALLTLGCLL